MHLQNQHADHIMVCYQHRLYWAHMNHSCCPGVLYQQNKGKYIPKQSPESFRKAIWPFQDSDLAGGTASTTSEYLQGLSLTAFPFISTWIPFVCACQVLFPSF